MPRRPTKAIAFTKANQSRLTNIMDGAIGNEYTDIDDVVNEALEFFYNSKFKTITHQTIPDHFPKITPDRSPKTTHKAPVDVPVEPPTVQEVPIQEAAVGGEDDGNFFADIM